MRSNDYSERVDTVILHLIIGGQFTGLMSVQLNEAKAKGSLTRLCGTLSKLNLIIWLLCLLKNRTLRSFGHVSLEITAPQA